MTIAFILLATSCGGSGFTRWRGQYVLAESGHSYFLRENSSQVIRIIPKEDSTMFDALSTGDFIEIKFVIIESNGDLEYTYVFDIKEITKLKTPQNISPDIMSQVESLDLISNDVDTAAATEVE